MAEWTCSICLDNNKDNVVKLEPCGHMFHAICIVTALRINGVKCPYCRGVDNRCTNNKSQNNQVVQNSNDIDNLTFEDISEIQYLLSDSTVNYVIDNNLTNFISGIWNDDLTMTEEEEEMLIDNIDGISNEHSSNDTESKVCS